jgi:hypothetical protein
MGFEERDDVFTFLNAGLRLFPINQRPRFFKQPW